MLIELQNHQRISVEMHFKLAGNYVLLWFDLTQKEGYGNYFEQVLFLSTRVTVALFPYMTYSNNGDRPNLGKNQGSIYSS